MEQKDEASSENGKASNNSSGFVATSKKSKEYTEKGSDAQVGVFFFHLKSMKLGIASNLLYIKLLFYGLHNFV